MHSQRDEKYQTGPVNYDKLKIVQSDEYSWFTFAVNLVHEQRPHLDGEKEEGSRSEAAERKKDPEDGTKMPRSNGKCDERDRSFRDICRDEV